MAKDDPSGVVVAGAGPVGLAAAVALADAGQSVTLVGPPPRQDDGRTTALMVPAVRWLESLGLMARLAKDSAPLRAMRIVDATDRLVRSPAVTFHAAEIGEPWFGLNFPNAALNAALVAHVEGDKRIGWKRDTVARWTLGDDGVSAQLSSGGEVFARLAVAADGRDSPARQAAGIVVRGARHPQAALVLTFAHARPHGSISTEFHTETGPFTTVPLPGDRSSLVWVVKPETAELLAELQPDALARRVEDRMQSMLGRVTLEARPQVYPLSSSLPSAFARNRVALVGEAAHLFPPIGAQGLNLGIRDVRDLAEIVARHPDDPGDETALRAYERKRRPDILARSGAVRLLNRSLLSDLLPAQIARSAGLGLLGAFAPLRAFFMREGLSPGSGFSALLSTPREQIGR